MGEEAFDGHILTEKLSKLNSSQQSIESLSRWCISFRKKAKQIVETWDKLFKSVQRDQRVSLLYLSNDILQNSRRKGSEFVNEFWKVLPSALKNVYENGGESGKKVATRLVGIWEERRVFGSRGQNLKEDVLGKNPVLGNVSLLSTSNGKSSNPIKVVKKDANSLRLKLAVGAMPEKIISAFQLVLDEDVNEEGAINKCEGAVSLVEEMGKDIGNVSSQGNLQGSEVVEKIKEQEELLQQCVSQLENAEATRVALVSQLKEALQDQESKLEQIHSKLQVARGQIEQAANLRQKLASPSLSTPPLTTTNVQMEASKAVESNLYSAQFANSTLPPQTPPVTSFATPKLSEEESTKAAAAAVAAKLAASTSSAQMLTSVLSSLVAEEAATKSSGLNSAGFSPFAPPEKRQKLENQMPFSEVNNAEGGNSTYYLASQQQPVNNVPSSGMQHISQANQMQSPYPPPPPTPSSNTPPSQLIQSSAMMMGVMPYGYGASNLPPPAHMAMGLARPAPPHQQQPQSQQPQSQPHQQQPQSQQHQQPPQSQQHQQQPQSQQHQQQQQQATGGYYRPPGIGFYGQSHQTATPPVPRQ